MARNYRGDRLACAVVGNVDEVEAERQPELFAHEMYRSAGPAPSEVVFARIGFDEGDEVFDRLCRH